MTDHEEAVERMVLLGFEDGKSYEVLADDTFREIDMESETIDTSNKFFVGCQGEQLVIMRQPSRLSKPDALNLAAWLVALADLDDEFPTILKAIRNT